LSAAIPRHPCEIDIYLSREREAEIRDQQ